MRDLRLAGVLATAAATLVVTFATGRAETCHRTSGQYAETETCVTSVLPPQGGNTYGPDFLTGSGEGAWCEGAAGAGIGQTITLRQTPDQVIGSIVFANGYGKSAQAFRNNGRVKRARIETSGGYDRTITLKDTAQTQFIRISPSRITWVRMTILDVYPGGRHADTCVSSFYFDHEEFGLDAE